MADCSTTFPIDVAKEMGADIVIGIHLETQPLSPSAPLSSFAVLGQSISVMIAANELRSMEQADVLVTVPLQKYNALDYGAAEAIIKAGYDAAAAKAKVLSAFSVSEAEWQQYLADRNARKKTTPIPEFVQVAGANSRVGRFNPEETVRKRRQTSRHYGSGCADDETPGRGSLRKCQLFDG